MLKKSIALLGLGLGFAFTMNAAAAPMSMVQAWHSMAPGDQAAFVAEACVFPIGSCNWQEADELPGDGWMVLFERERVDIYTSENVEQSFAVVLKKPLAVVPLPAAAWLFMSALVGLGRQPEAVRKQRLT